MLEDGALPDAFQQSQKYQIFDLQEQVRDLREFRQILVPPQAQEINDTTPVELCK